MFLKRFVFLLFTPPFLSPPLASRYEMIGFVYPYSSATQVFPAQLTK